MNFPARPLVLPVLLFSLAGCGLKGPLYLPDQRPEQVPAKAADPAPAPAPGPTPVLEGSKVRTLPPAPQSQKKDRANSSTAPSQSTPSPTTPPDPTPPPPPGQ